MQHSLVLYVREFSKQMKMREKYILDTNSSGVPLVYHLCPEM